VLSDQSSEPADLNDPSALADPADRPAVERLAGFKRRDGRRNVRRSQLMRFQWIYERTGARHALRRFRTHVETEPYDQRREGGITHRRTDE